MYNIYKGFPMLNIKQCLIFILLLTQCSFSLFAHDLWLGAKWNAKKTHIQIIPLVGEHFSTGEAIKDHRRFENASAYLTTSKRLALSSDNKDSTVLGTIERTPSFVVSTGVKQREISYNDSIAILYLTEEIGLTKEKAAEYLTPGVKEYSETYSRHLKTVVITGETIPKDTAIDVPLQIQLLSWKAVDTGKALVRLRILENGKPLGSIPVRVVSGGTTKIVNCDSSGVAETDVDPRQPILLAYIQLKKLSDNRLNSVWTNLAIYRLP